MRSWLFVPGDSEHKITKALASNADVVILDLEDSVALANKDEARGTVGRLLADLPATSCQVFVRVNPLDTPLCQQDTDALSKNPPNGYMLPKSQSGKDVTAFATQIGNNLPVIAIATETAASLFNLGSYECPGTSLVALTWGAEDLSSDLGAISARDKENVLGDPYRLARSLCLIGARAAQVEPIDSIYANFRDNTGLRRECEAAVRDGFSGKMAIHPDQIDTINDAFTPTPEALKHAQKIVDAFSQDGNSAPTKGVIAIDGQMFDLPHLNRAKKLLARASRYNSG